MKFKNSLMEDRYNTYWNANVVPLDNKIRATSSGQGLFNKNVTIQPLLEKYKQHVQNILSNLERQADLFEDKNYIQEYKKNTITQAVEDLNLYARTFPDCREISKKLIDALTQEQINFSNHSYN